MSLGILGRTKLLNIFIQEIRRFIEENEEYRYVLPVNATLTTVNIRCMDLKIWGIQMNSKSLNGKNGRLVLPGERLGVIEEFTAYAGTYVKDGVIYSIVVGRALLDLSNKRVSVHPLIRRAKVPKIASVVLGQVSRVQKQNAFVRIHEISGNQLSGFFSGLLHISDVQLRYVDSMFDVCKPGDIVRAKVISEKNRTYHLSTKDRNLGVVYAFCSQCGYMLELKRQRMHCLRCGKIETRKTALDYGKGVTA